MKTRLELTPQERLACGEQSVNIRKTIINYMA